jgi:hypothetical protein
MTLGLGGMHLQLLRQIGWHFYLMGDELGLTIQMDRSLVYCSKIVNKIMVFTLHPKPRYWSTMRDRSNSQ